MLHVSEPSQHLYALSHSKRFVVQSYRLEIFKKLSCNILQEIVFLYEIPKIF